MRRPNALATAYPRLDAFPPGPAWACSQCTNVSTGIEAAVRFGWDRWLGERGGFVGMAGFGACGPADELYEHFGITPAAVVAQAKGLLGTQ